MKIDYKINENKINQMLDELNEDRNKLFNDVKSTTSNDLMKENKIKQLENIQRALLSYKKLLIKEKEKEN
jgi:hypothetical protein